MRVGDHVTCGCAPACARSWQPGHGPCVSGVVLEVDMDGDEGPEALVRQDHGGIYYLQDIGYGQRIRRQSPSEVWALLDGLIIA